MNWSENGGPPVKPPERRGFGAIVIDLMVKRAIDGAVRLDYAPSGVVWRLTASAANALLPRDKVDLKRNRVDGPPKSAPGAARS
jgi:hypothetical protein